MTSENQVTELHDTIASTASDSNAENDYKDNTTPSLPTSALPSNSNALRLSWAFGFSKDLVNGVHSLSTDTRRAVFYAAAHTGVLYDFAQRQQKLLQGHCHPISCCVVSEDKRWVVTADRGKESMIVVWDSMTGNPIKTIFQPHPNGVQTIDISPDALFLVTLSAVDQQQNNSMDKKKKKRFQQELSIWEWTAPPASKASSNAPLYSSYVATEDVQHSVRFNTYDIREVVTTGRQRVIFWNWQEQRLLFYSPSLSQRDFRQVIGAFTQSIFVPDSKQALTGTEDGDLVLWDVVQSEDDDENANNSLHATGSMTASGRFPDRKAVKIVRLAGGADKQKPVALTVLTDMDGYLVLGSSDGAVRFYDFDFRLVAWFEDMNAGPVMSVSFSAASSISKGTNSQKEEEEDFFNVPEFIVATSSAFIVGMSAGLFAEYGAEQRRGTLLMQGTNAAILAVATHPKYAQLAVAAASGVVQLWDYATKRLVMMKKFDGGARPQCLAFSPSTEGGSSTKIFVGFGNGVIKLLHAQKFEELATLRLGKSGITDIRISPDANLFVALDANLYMGMWRRKNVPSPSQQQARTEETKDAEEEEEDDWAYIGRCRAHSKPVTGLEFGQDNDGNPLLVSVAEDKTLVEYCLSRSSILDGIVLTQSPVRIEQSGTPTACCWHPEMRSLQEDLVLVANDEYKIKQWNAKNKICRKTTLGPSYGGPINKLVAIPARTQSNTEGLGSVEERYCAYSTHAQVVGLIKLPLDGNPYKTMGLIAHPNEIASMAVTCDGNYLVTAGGADLVVNLWEIHTDQLDLLEAQLHGETSSSSVFDVDADLEPYLSLLEGGKDGEFYNEIVDYFYLAQLRVQGENATSPREITSRIPLQEIPNVMRALGFYPTNQEIQHMCSEVKYSQFTQTTQTVESIDLKEFIKLYVNHRPVFGIGKQQIEKAFQVLATGGKDGGEASLRWDILEKRLLHMGENMTEEELRSCLNALVVGDEAGRIVLDPHYTALSFADKILGFDDYEGGEEDGEDEDGGVSEY